MTEQLPPPPAYGPSDPTEPTVPAGPRDHRRWWRAGAVALAALVLVGAGVGVGMAATTPGSDSAGMGMGMSAAMANAQPAAKTATPAGKQAACERPKTRKNGKPVKVHKARQAWAHKYGVDRCTMPNLAPVAKATAAQRDAASTLLTQTEAATAKDANLATAKAAGFNLSASLARAEKAHPRLAEAIARVDASGVPAGHMPPMLHVGNKANRYDGKLLDPTAPETLMYSYTGHGSWKLIGVMFTAGEAYPNPPPDPGGPIMRWHYHPRGGGQSLMMHVFFVPGNDLAHAYAATMT